MEEDPDGCKVKNDHPSEEFAFDLSPIYSIGEIVEMTEEHANLSITAHDDYDNPVSSVPVGDTGSTVFLNFACAGPVMPDMGPHLTTGALPVAYQTGSGLTAAEFDLANATRTAILGSVPTRTTAGMTLYVRSSASPTGLTLLRNSSGSAVHALFDAQRNPVALPADIALPAGTALSVTAYTDLPAVGSYLALEVTSLTVTALPCFIDPDTDGGLGTPAATQIRVWLAVK